MRNGKNRGQHKDRDVRPKIMGDFPGGLTSHEMEVWYDRISNIRVAILDYGVFRPEARGWWRDYT